MSTATSPPRLGIAALLVSHCAGMIDLAALPLWVGVLVGDRHLDPQRAGGLVSLFLLAACLTSVVLATRIRLARTDRVAAVSFLGGAIVFGMLHSATSSYGLMAALHLLGGVAIGAALSATHGTIGRSTHPHRLFAHAALSFGLFAILFFVVAQKLMGQFGSPVFFYLVSGVMTVAALMCAYFFPRAGDASAGVTPLAVTPPLKKVVWFGIVGVSLMALNQTMASSFLQRVGLDRHFAPDAVNSVLVAMAVLTIPPGPFAAYLENRISARFVTLCGPIAQLIVIFTLTHATSFPFYAVAGAILTSIQIFTHTFAFGLLAQWDKSGRATAATPAMLMIGSAFGPFFSGSLVKYWGYGAIGDAAIGVGLLSMLSYWWAQPKAHNLST